MYRALSVPAYATGGMVWGIIALLFGGKAFDDAVWFGVFASPFIGVAVGLAIHRRFEEAGPRARWLLALISLYLGGTLFGIAVGLHAAVAAETRPFMTGISEGVASTWYGLTGTGFFLMFWPLAYLSHRVLARAMGVTLPD